MALLPLRRLFTNNLKKYGALTPLRNLTSKQLVYSEFGEPLNVVKFKEVEIPKLGPQDVLVRMLAAPINPADINTIQGTYLTLNKTILNNYDKNVFYIFLMKKNN